jgi:DNA-binding CsgD family transcriptional regulator
MSEQNNSKKTKVAQLTKTEIAILIMIADGLSSKSIAEIKQISLRTVEKHRGNIIAKLNISKNTNSLTKWAMLNKNLLA